MGLPLVVDWPPTPMRTPRLVVRPRDRRDDAHLLALVTDAEVYRFLGGPRDPQEAAAHLSSQDPSPCGQFVAEHDGAFVGWFSLSRREPQRPGGPGAGGDLELSYLLPVAAWGHGYAREACAAVLAWADELLAEEIVLCTQTANVRSLALAEHLGFSEVARFEEFGAEQWFGVRNPPGG